ncbi:hypothetical protein PSECIP111951_03903 [Pseudoalteromonas holothuriae]|uniref:Uncharacterized protein n=1 Tax=Pseudoalteromonas holothuriae TaxID=2963714 RepID=A0A9W4QYP7_9GAMM|nr:MULTISPECIES: hypothetical protein [unclassified Pseudoalteromonas]CAH9059249.1 hypothetical protein PSECIP111854_02368 [Pseudoalteromonas sp. CIP111854]CAH9067807.1 hypothetical protein PSECIP111951_03903 [Pseudoalteromonas sp. CIP111951]
MTIKTALFFTLLILTSLATTAEEKPEPPPLNPAYHGEHPMVLLNQGASIYAANLPTYDFPNNVQVVYKIENPGIAFLSLVRDADLVSIKPKAFNIERLMRGEEVEVTADVYSGHYGKGGSKLLSNAPIVFSKKLYSRTLNDLTPSSQWQEYDMIPVSSDGRIYIHKIQQPPSFNHLIFVDLSSACMQKFRTSKRVPPHNELTIKFVNCGSLKPLYYDTQNLDK